MSTYLLYLPICLPRVPAYACYLLHTREMLYRMKRSVCVLLKISKMGSEGQEKGKEKGREGQSNCNSKGGSLEWSCLSRFLALSFSLPCLAFPCFLLALLFELLLPPFPFPDNHSDYLDRSSCLSLLSCDFILSFSRTAYNSHSFLILVVFFLSTYILMIVFL